MLDDDALEGLDVHFLDPSGVSVGLGTGPEWLPAVQTFLRGETLRLSAEVVDASRDRFGFSFFSMADDPEAQTLRWGKVRIGIGPSPVLRSVPEPPSAQYRVANHTDAVYGRSKKYVVDVSENTVQGTFRP